VRSSPPSEEFNNTFKKVFQLFKKYQIAIHKDAPSDVSEKSFRRFLVESPLEEVNLLF